MRDTLIGLHIHGPVEGHYTFDIYVMDDITCCASVEDCFGAGLAEMTVIIGGLTYAKGTSATFRKLDFGFDRLSGILGVSQDALMKLPVLGGFNGMSGWPVGILTCRIGTKRGKRVVKWKWYNPLTKQAQSTSCHFLCLGPFFVYLPKLTHLLPEAWWVKHRMPRPTLAIPAAAACLEPWVPDPFDQVKNFRVLQRCWADLKVILKWLEMRDVDYDHAHKSNFMKHEDHLHLYSMADSTLLATV